MTSRVDGRDSRWAQHRAQRRRELVDAALRAIRKHGPSVGMDDIASEAGTSKTVVYRHFGDRTGLYVAVVESVDQRILDSLSAAMVDTDPDDATALVGAMVDAYLMLVEKDPEIYRFVVTRPLVDAPVNGDPVAGITDRIGAQVTRVLRSYLLRHGQDASCAETWGSGLVGFVRAAADHWLTSEQPRPRAAVVADVTTLFAPAFNAIGATAYSPTPEHDED